jgi:hypothetical protein
MFGGQKPISGGPGVVPAEPRRPVTRRTREEDPVLHVRFPATFPAESVANSGGFAEKILGVISCKSV